MAKILEPNPNRFVLYPIQYHDIFDLFKKHEEVIWKAQEIDLSEDVKMWQLMEPNKKNFIRNVLAFFAASDGIVNENLAENFMREVQYPEARCFYGTQIHMENVHSETYSLLIDTYISDEKEKHDCLHAIETMPTVAKKAEWALKWVESDSFAERLLAFVAVEMIFFSGSFASIFWLKNQGVNMPGLFQANEFIFRDENMHGEFGILLLNNYLEGAEKPSEEVVRNIFLDALAVEKEFITESIPVAMIGMNSDLMIQYLEFIIDGLMVKLKYDKIFNVSNPFKFMENITVEGKTNFFEKRVTEYKKADLSQDFLISDDF